MDWTMRNISLKAAVNLAGLTMLGCALALCYAIPLHVDEALLGRDRGVLVDAPVTWKNPETHSLTYQYEVGGQSHSRTWRAPTWAMDKIGIGDSVEVRYSRARPSYSRTLAELDGRQIPSRLFIVGLLVVFAASLVVMYLGTSWEHIEPVRAARRRGEKPPRSDVLKIWHNLGALIALAAGAVAIGMVCVSGVSGSHYVLRTPGMVLAVAAWIGFMALRKWTPF